MVREEPWEVKLLGVLLLLGITVIPAILLSINLYPEKVGAIAGTTMQWGALALGLGPLMFVALIAYVYLKHQFIVRRLEEHEAYKKVKLKGWEAEMEEEIEESFVSPYEHCSFYADRMS